MGASRTERAIRGLVRRAQVALGWTAPFSVELRCFRSAHIAARWDERRRTLVVDPRRWAEMSVVERRATAAHEAMHMFQFEQMGRLEHDALRPGRDPDRALVLEWWSCTDPRMVRAYRAIERGIAGPRAAQAYARYRAVPLERDALVFEEVFRRGRSRRPQEMRRIAPEVDASRRRLRSDQHSSYDPQADRRWRRTRAGRERLLELLREARRVRRLSAR